MTDDLKDIDPEIVQKIIEHADVFIDIDTRVNGVVDWGEQELKSQEEQMKAAGALTIESLQAARKTVEMAVADKLKTIEKEIQTLYGGTV